MPRRFWNIRGRIICAPASVRATCLARALRRLDGNASIGRRRGGGGLRGCIASYLRPDRPTYPRRRSFSRPRPSFALPRRDGENAGSAQRSPRRTILPRGCPTRMARDGSVVVRRRRTDCRPGGGRHRQRWKTKMLGAGIAVADADFPDGRRCRTHRRQLERGSERTDDASRREPGHGGTLRGANYFSRRRRRPG